MLEKKKIAWASLLSLGILSGGSFAGNSSVSAAPNKSGNNVHFPENPVTKITPILGWQKTSNDKIFYTYERKNENGNTEIIRAANILKKINDIWYCFDKNGVLLTSCWKTVKDKSYYLNEDGAAVKYFYVKHQMR